MDSKLSSEMMKVEITRNNIVSGFLIQDIDIKKFVPSHESKSLDLDFLPPNASIVATSEQGIIVFEISKIQNHWKNVYYVCKPATKQVLALPKLKNKYETVKVAIVVLDSNPLHYKIVRWSHHETKPFSCFNYVVTRKVSRSRSRYVTYHYEIFDSMTWEWKQTGMLRLPFSFIRNYPQPITTSGSIYMFLTTITTILKFDTYSETSTIISLPVPTFEDHFKASRQLIKYEEKLGFACKPPNGYWEIWVLNADQSWEKIDGFEENNETLDGLFGLGMGISNDCNSDSKSLVLLNEQLNNKMFVFKSDFETVDLAGRKKSSIANSIRHFFFKTGQ